VLNQEQLAAIQSEEKKLVIIAPPGSGKTFTMVRAIDYYLEQNGNANVVAITFTKKAAGELATAFFGNDHIHASTIHSWSYSHLENMAKKWGFRVRLLQEEQIKDIIRPFFKLYNLDPDRNMWAVYHYVMGSFNMDLEDHIKNKYRAILARYLDYKRKRRLYDFTDLPLYLHDVLMEYEEYIEVDGLFVDEFQDVDPVQLKVFKRVEANKYFFIGDPQQAIYIFRGASEEIFDELDDYQVMPLKHNYRSYQEILDFASTVRRNLVERHSSILQTTEVGASDIIAERGAGGEVFSESMYPKIEFRKIVRAEFIDHHYTILCRTNKQVKALEDLGYRDAMTIHKAKGLEFDNVVVVDFPIEDEEAINVAFVALTRAKNKQVVMTFEALLRVLEVVPADAKTKTITTAF
jgi:DNA helicase-2/ATP-dependent DNA helicase PcrA